MGSNITATLSPSQATFLARIHDATTAETPTFFSTIFNCATEPSHCKQSIYLYLTSNVYHLTSNAVYYVTSTPVSSILSWSDWLISFGHKVPHPIAETTMKTYESVKVILQNCESLVASQLFPNAQEILANNTVVPFRAILLIGPGLFMGWCGSKMNANMTEAFKRFSMLITGQRKLTVLYSNPYDSTKMPSMIVTQHTADSLALDVAMHVVFTGLWAGVASLAKQGIVNALVQAGENEGTKAVVTALAIITLAPTLLKVGRYALQGDSSRTYEPTTLSIGNREFIYTTPPSYPQHSSALDPQDKAPIIQTDWVWDSAKEQFVQISHTPPSVHLALAAPVSVSLAHLDDQIALEELDQNEADFPPLATPASLEDNLPDETQDPFHQEDPFAKTTLTSPSTLFLGGGYS